MNLLFNKKYKLSNKDIFNFVLILYILTMLCFYLFRETGYLALKNLKKEEISIQHEVKNMKKELRFWRYRVNSLIDGYDTYTFMIRDKLGYIRDDEIIIYFTQ